MNSFSEYIKETDKYAPTNEGDCINLMIDDDLLRQAKITGYNFDTTTIDDKGKEIPVNPKKTPNKAIQINLDLDNLPIEIYFNTQSRKWDSNFIYNGEQGKLSPDQFEQFFNSAFYDKLIKLVSERWPLTDKFYNELYQGILDKTIQMSEYMRLDDESLAETDDDQKANNDGHVKRRDLAGKDVTGDGRPDYTASGRKIVNFADQGVNAGSAIFTCWPKKGKEFNWSQWKDWKKLHPLCKLRFKYGKYYYTISVSVVKEYKHRGYRGANIDLKPPLQWLTPYECARVMNLSIFRKFTRVCVDRMTKYLDMSTDEIYSKMNNPDKITKEEIEKTKQMIRKTVQAVIRPRKSDDFCYKDSAPAKKVAECDAGTADGAPSGSISTGDVLGNCDHEHDGYLGPGCFHVPHYAIHEISGKKKRKHKNQYIGKIMKRNILSEAGMMSEMELDITTIRKIHQVPEEVIVGFIKKNFNLQTAKISLIGIFYHPITNTAFIKFKNGRLTQFVNVDFNGRKFVVHDTTIFDTEEAKAAFRMGAGDMSLWVIWGDVN